MLPLKPIKQIFMQKSSTHHVSTEVIIQTRDFLEKITTMMAQEAFNELDRYNHHRIQQGLREKKRLPGWIIKKISDNLLKQLSDNKTGLQPTGVSSPGGNNMPADNNATKPAEATDDAMEVA